ncbi:transposase [Caldibacillus thermoamylovorans]|nr:transposase [Caldibacillus thermoamylovorans]
MDEAHHFNANASVQKVDSGENPAAFESTMDTIRNAVKLNQKYVIQLEFTATLPFGNKGKNKKVRDKYLDKLLFNYTLKEFVIKDKDGNGGYGKHLSQIEANETVESKMLTGLLLNQYRKYLAIKHGFINFKPVILFKSNNVTPSYEAQATFENLLENLDVEQIEQHINRSLRGTDSQAINWFLEFYDNLDDKESFIRSLKEDFLGHILNANDDKNEERVINNLNTLDSIDNPYRAVFAVEKVSEGWDVLNLYDIVRVSEKGKKANTNAEAQLVGRGSRYYPLVSQNGEVINKQTFPENDERVMLETFHYHTIQDRDYLEQLSESYSALGIPIELDKPPVTFSTSLKPEFKKDYFYQYGFFMENTKTEPKEEEYTSLKAYGFRNGYKFRVSSGIREKRVFNDKEKASFQVIPKRIERKYIVEAMSRIPYYRFNIMKKDMPLRSKREFIDGDNWLGSWDHIIEFQLDENETLTEEIILHGTIDFLTHLSELIQDNFMKEKGIIAGLHTFGSRVNFNPHVHMLVTMGGLTKKGEWKQYDFLPFAMLRKQWQTVVLKLIRRGVSEKEKKRIQPRLQKAFSNNGQGFYVHAPKQKGNIKEQLRYIGRYIRRPAIGVNRIEAYDGQYVTFKYKDKTDGKEKTETVTVEEFISRLIRHIPDEQFKTIRHYGMYSRRIKNLCKKVLNAWQQKAKRWIVKVKKTLRRQTWRERIVAIFHWKPLQSFF